MENRILKDRPKLRREVFNLYVSYKYELVREPFEYFRDACSFYEFSFQGQCKIVIGDEEKYLKGVRKAIENYGFIGERWIPIIDATLLAMPSQINPGESPLFVKSLKLIAREVLHHFNRELFLTEDGLNSYFESVYLKGGVQACV